MRVAVLAKAPVPGFAKTRLIPEIGPEGAAALQERLIGRALGTALASRLGPVTLWCAPDTAHPCFREAEARGVELAVQPEADLGARMLAAFSRSSPLVLLGTDCPCLEPGSLREAALALEGGADAAMAPAEDGGYGLIAARAPFAALFEGIPWSTASVAEATRERARRAGLSLAELSPVWDVDTPEDYRRLVASGLLPSLQEPFRRQASA